MLQALVRARIPYLPVNIDDIDRDASQFSVLILPNLAAMSDAQANSIRKFVLAGGNLIATGNSSLYNEWGDKRTDFALADLFGAHFIVPNADAQPPGKKLAGDAYHTYLRLVPEMRAQINGPHKGPEPAITGKRHAILQGFEETDTIPFGGLLQPLRMEAGVEVLATYIPQFPVYPPEKAYMREPKTGIPGILLNEKKGQGRVIFVPADLDKQFGRTNLPDHGNLLKNMIRWAAKKIFRLLQKAPAWVDCHLYRQQNHLVLHIVNLTNAGTWRQPLDELITIGPLKIKVQLPKDVNGVTVKPLVANAPIVSKIAGGWCQFELPSVSDHEVLVIG